VSEPQVPRLPCFGHPEGSEGSRAALRAWNRDNHWWFNWWPSATGPIWRIAEIPKLWIARGRPREIFRLRQPPLKMTQETL